MAIEAPEDNDEFGGIDPATVEGLPSATQFLESFYRKPVLYYPGGGCDVDPILLFYKHSGIRCFVYADFDQLLDRVPGFRTQSQGSLTPESLGVREWRDLWPPTLRAMASEHDSGPSGVWTALDPENGGEPITLISLRGEAAHIYWILWAKRGKAADVIVLQDHGFAGNPSKFGAGGLLCEYATATTLPKLLYVARNTDPWPGFVPCSKFGDPEGERVCGDPEGPRGHRRAIFARSFPTGAWFGGDGFPPP